MNRLVSMGIEVFAALIVLIPFFLLLNIVLFHNVRKVVAYFMFCVYLTAVYAVVGLPSITYIRFEPHINIVPFLDMIADYKNAILNVVLFVPLGIMLPLLWEEFKNMKNTVLLGLGMTLIIEIFQIFTFRATDINDIITNVAGTMFGYFIANIIMKKCSVNMMINGKKIEVFFLFGITFGVMFLIQPFIASIMWEMVL